MGFFTKFGSLRLRGAHGVVAIPFRVGWGFSRPNVSTPRARALVSQSLSGWDGVFHKLLKLLEECGGYYASQSLSGWDGVFHWGWASGS